MLPADWGVMLDASARRSDGGRILVGGSPPRMLRLTDSGARYIDQLARGEPIGDGKVAQRLVRRLLDLGIAHPRPTVTPRETTDISVVIPVHDCADQLAALLPRLGKVGEIIVVDDGSREPSTAAVAAELGSTLVRHESNRGPASARNTGWRRASSELVAFIDADCVPAPGWLEALLPHFDDPQVAAVAPRLTGAASLEVPRLLGLYEQARPALDRGRRSATVHPGSRVPFVPTAALVIRRDALLAVGGFDEAMRAGEDVDLIWRLVRTGATVRYDPSATVAHLSRRSLRAWLHQRFDYGTSAAPLARRHGSALAPLTLSPFTAGTLGLVAAGSPLAGLGIALGSIVRMRRKTHALRHPWREAIRFTCHALLSGSVAVVGALRRPWSPAVLIGAVVSRRARRVALLALVVPALLDWVRDRPPVDPVRWACLRLADDVAYGCGVWAGCISHYSFVPLVPALSKREQ